MKMFGLKKFKQLVMEYNNKTQPIKQNSQNQTNQPTKPSEKNPT